MALELEINSHLCAKQALREREHKRDLVLPDTHSVLLDWICKKVKNTVGLGQDTYGKAYVDTEKTQIYTDGSCLSNGTPHARAGAGVWWGEGSPNNCSERVPGPGRQTNNRGEVYAILMALRQADPCTTLRILSDSEYAIRQICYSAQNKSDKDWNGPNGDMLLDIKRLIKARLAPIHFKWIKAHNGNSRGDAADALA
ncbi:ribonuclease H-like domain-containing protein, partial [Crassisporium funariophilum]